MAKSTSFFGIRRGSTKSHTYQGLRGEQITKDRVTEVSNPQSTKQMEQRLITPLVASARSQLQGLVNHSFEGVDYGYKSLYQFSSINMNKGGLTVLQYVPKGAMDCGVADFVVSRGTLPNIEVSAVLASDEEAAALSIPGIPTTETTLTLDRFVQTIGTYVFNQTGIEGIVQLSFLFEVEVNPEYSWTASGVSYSNKRHSFILSRLFVDSHSNNIDAYATPAEVTEKNTGWSIKTTGTNTYAITDGYVNVSMKTVNGLSPFYIQVQDRTKNAVTASESMVAGCVILSQETSSGKWKRSSNRLAFLTNKTINYAACEPSYKKDASESDRYLNFGSDSTYIAGAE